MHIHITGSLRLQVATDLALNRNGDCIVNVEGSVAKDLYLHAKQEILPHPIYSWVPWFTRER